MDTCVGGPTEDVFVRGLGGSGSGRDLRGPRYDHGHLTRRFGWDRVLS